MDSLYVSKMIELKNSRLEASVGCEISKNDNAIFFHPVIQFVSLTELVLGTGTTKPTQKGVTPQW